MRFLTAGESHGKALVAILEGLPAQLTIDHEQVNAMLARRMQGIGRGARMQIEQDEVQFLSGLRGSVTTGAPIAMMIENKDYDAKAFDPIKGDGSLRGIYAPRPSHVDYAACQKYKSIDARNFAERASARETAIRTAIGACCMSLLSELDIHIVSAIKSIGHLQADTQFLSFDSVQKNGQFSDKNLQKNAQILVQEICQKGDTIGGEILLFCRGVRAGVGSHIQFDKKLDYILCGLLGGIQGVKTVCVGASLQNELYLGSNYVDKITLNSDQKSAKKIVRKTNNCGGIEGGISNGEDIIISLSCKPIPSIFAGVDTVDLRAATPTKTAYERGDTCVVEALGVVAEAVLAYGICDAILQRTGGDTLAEVKQRWNLL